MEKKNLSTNLKLLRFEKEWTQQNVAQRLNISIPTYSKYETGSTDINLSKIQKLAKIYNTTVVRLLSPDEEDYRSHEVSRLKKKLSESQITVIELQAELLTFYKQVRI